ncbi:MAG: hypothetical protein K6T29_00745 [Peptococcaceae bacterium]|nr:hypothetical protein [Peptococcaceae bacterium]
MGLAERRPAPVFDSGNGLLNYRVSPETMVIRYKEYICGDLEKVSEESAPEELRGMDRKALIGRFPAAEGWAVDFGNPGFLTITRRAEEFCPVHRDYRHLGCYHGLVAVYEGPLGFNDRLLKVENIPLESLSPEFRIKLEQAMDFDKQARSTVEKLREELEFASEEALNAVLENLDEHT